MKINIKTNDNGVLIELLSQRGFEHDKNAPVALIEKGAAIPDNSISIVYDPARLDDLTDFLDDMHAQFNAKGASISNEVITGKSDERYEIIRISSVPFFKAHGNLVQCIKDNELYIINKKLYELEADLFKKGFIRVNKSYLVNIMWIREICPWFSGRLLLIIKEYDNEIEVSRRYMKNFKKYLGL